MFFLIFWINNDVIHGFSCIYVNPSSIQSRQHLVLTTVVVELDVSSRLTQQYKQGLVKIC